VPYSNELTQSFFSLRGLLQNYPNSPFQKRSTHSYFTDSEIVVRNWQIDDYYFLFHGLPSIYLVLLLLNSFWLKFSVQTLS
jgi:hypothetical protein